MLVMRLKWAWLAENLKQPIQPRAHCLVSHSKPSKQETLCLDRINSAAIPADMGLLDPWNGPARSRDFPGIADMAHI